MDIKILYVCNQFLPDIGGVANYIYKSGEFFPESIKIFVFTIKTRSTLSADEKIENIHIKRFRSQFNIGPFIMSLRLISHLIRHNKEFDLINFQGFYRFSTFIAVVLKLIGAKVIITSHGLAIDTPLDSKLERLQKYIYDRTIIPFLSYFCSRIIVVSGPEKYYLQKCGVPKSKIIIVHGGVDTKFLENNKSPINSLNIPFNNTLIGYIGNYESRKNIQHVLKLLSNFKKEDNISLILVGPYTGEQVYELKMLAFKLNIEEKVIIGASLSDADVIEFYKVLDLLIFPSRCEGFPLVLIESALYGVPFVAYDIPSMRYANSILQSGSLAEYANIYDLTCKAKQILSNKKFRSSLSEKGMHNAKKISWQKTAECLIDVYKDITNADARETQTRMRARFQRSR